LILLRHTTNKGKGASLRTGLSCATGDIVVFQDADTEYSPPEISELISPIINNTADVVYGSRFIGKKTEHFFIHTYLANKLLSWLTKIKTGLPITDMETCYKAFRSPLLKNISLTENRFGIEPEITVKIARIKKIRYTEIPISYSGRSIREGKKVRWQDGVRALWCILWY
jgi:glycosyltransferase involved in cell wall biosynthesis